MVMALSPFAEEDHPWLVASVAAGELTGLSSATTCHRLHQQMHTYCQFAHRIVDFPTAERITALRNVLKMPVSGRILLERHEW
jgi:hypothetical protein